MRQEATRADSLLKARELPREDSIFRDLYLDGKMLYRGTDRSAKINHLKLDDSLRTLR